MSAHVAGCHHSKLLAYNPGPGAPSAASSGPLPLGTAARSDARPRSGTCGKCRETPGAALSIPATSCVRLGKTSYCHSKCMIPRPCPCTPTPAGQSSGCPLRALASVEELASHRLEPGQPVVWAWSHLLQPWLASQEEGPREELGRGPRRALKGPQVLRLGLESGAPSFYMPLLPQQGTGQAEFGPLIFWRARGGLCGVRGERLGCAIWSTTPHALGKLLNLSTTQLSTCKTGCPPFQAWLQG